MVKILRGEMFISVMAAVFLASLWELFFGQGHIDSAVIYLAMVFSSIGLLSGLIAASAAGRRGGR